MANAPHARERSQAVTTAASSPAPRAPSSPHAPGADLGEIASQLSSISENLLASYARLERRAERVERDLVVANLELGRRMDEVESLRARLDAVLRALPCGVVVRDADGAIASVNPAAVSLLAASEDELQRATDRAHPVLEDAIADGIVREHVLADGARRALAVRRSLIRGDAGGGSVIIVDDRTEERRLESKLASSSKMAALGTMAAGIAHEVRNPLNAVRGFAELLRLELDPDERSHRFATRICDGVDEIDGIVKSLLGFAAPEKLSRDEIDPEHLALQAIAAAKLEACRPENAERWTIRASIDCPRFRADLVKLRQALKNLVANAVQAQPRGGEIAVELRCADGVVRMRVHDGGPGLSEALRARAGEPFLTTRAGGTGLGLALVHAIAAVHGGTFEIAPDPGPLGGADARIVIPHQPC
jgi:two-component system sensor histidine kinase FlrB